MSENDKIDELEPLFSLEVATELIPCSLQYLKNYLVLHADEFPARYSGENRYRLLSRTEIMKLRKTFVLCASHKLIIKESRYKNRKWESPHLAFYRK